MCSKRLAFGGTHPHGISGVRATEYKFPFSEFVPHLMCRERLGFGGTHPAGISGVRATESKFPFRSLCRRTQVSLSWRDELQRHGPRGLAGGSAAERKYRRGDCCPGARRASTQTKSLNKLPLTETLFKAVPLSSEHTTHIKYIGHPEQRALRAKDEKNTWVTTDY